MKLLAKYWVKVGREFDEVEWYLREDHSVLAIKIDHQQISYSDYWTTYESIGDRFIDRVLNDVNYGDLDYIDESFIMWLYSDSHAGEYVEEFYEFLIRYDLLADLIGVHQGDEDKIERELLNF